MNLLKIAMKHLIKHLCIGFEAVFSFRGDMGSTIFDTSVVKSMIDVNLLNNLRSKSQWVLPPPRFTPRDQDDNFYLQTLAINEICFTIFTTPPGTLHSAKLLTTSTFLHHTGNCTEYFAIPFLQWLSQFFTKFPILQYFDGNDPDPFGKRNIQSAGKLHRHIE